MERRNIPYRLSLFKFYIYVYDIIQVNKVINWLNNER